MRLSQLVPHLPFLIPLWLITLSVYLYTKAPSILYIDAGTIIAAAAEPGIPNPPGFPFYIMIAHLFTKLPFATVLFRVQLLSILSALGVLTLVYAAIHRFLSSDFAFVSQAKTDQTLFARSFIPLRRAAMPASLLKSMVSLATTFVLGFSYQFWSQTLNTESYIFTNFMLMLLLTLVLTTPSQPKRLMKRAILASFLLGIASGANPTIVQVVPALVLGVFFFWKYIGYKKLAVMGLIAFLFLALVYSYLPLRAMGYPFLNWGNPQTVELFLGHLRGAGLNIYDPRTNSINGFTGSPTIMVQSIGRYVYLFFMQFTPVLTPLIFLGVYYLFRKNRKLFLLLFSIPLTNMIFGVLYLSGNQESWFIASYVIFAMFMGVGFSVVVKVFLARSAAGPARAFPPPLTLLMLLVLLLLCVIPFAWWFPKLNRHDFIATTEYADNLYANILPNSVLIGSGDFFNQLTHYEYGVLKRRRDVFPVVANMWYILPWYRETLRKHRPELMPIELEKIKKDRLEEYNEVMNSWIRGLLDRGVSVYVTPMVFRETVLAGTNAGKYVVDKTKLKAVNTGLVYRMLTEKDLLQPNEAHFTYKFTDAKFYLTARPFYLERNYNAAFNLMLREYGASFLGMADYFMEIGNKEKELEYLKRAYEIAPFAADIVNRFGIYAISQGNLKDAIRLFKEATEADPKSFEVKLNLARALLALGNEIEGKRQLETIAQGAEEGTLKNEAQQELSKLKLRQIAESVPAEWATLAVPSQKFKLRYPDKWQVQQQGSIYILVAPVDGFTISLQGGVLPQGLDKKTWVKMHSQLRFPGVIEREGPAQIPGFDATAAFWDEKGPGGLVKVLEFVLVQPFGSAQGEPFDTERSRRAQGEQNRILHIKVRPTESEMMKYLDSILSTITFTE